MADQGGTGVDARRQRQVPEGPKRRVHQQRGAVAVVAAGDLRRPRPLLAPHSSGHRRPRFGLTQRQGS